MPDHKIINVILGIMCILILIVAFMSGWNTMFDDAVRTLEKGICPTCKKPREKQNCCQRS